MTLLFLPDVSVAFYASQISGTEMADVENFTFALYVTNYAPVLADTMSTYNAIECGLDGYVRQTWTPASWVGGVTAGVYAAAASAVTFVFLAYGGGATIYGVYLIVTLYDATQWLGGAQLLPTPYLVPALGGSYAITPTLNVKSE
jgi:hypothetical protein